MAAEHSLLAELEEISKGYSQFGGLNDAVLGVAFGLTGNASRQIVPTVNGSSVGPSSRRPMQSSVTRSAL